METNFEDLGLNPSLIGALEVEDITTATDIQSQVIPVINSSKDIIFQSPTGTGKTLAYLLPILDKISQSPSDTRALILAPTHELVIQIEKQIVSLSSNSQLNFTSTPLLGGVNITRQIDKLKKKPQIMVGSPGRILELIKKKKIKAHTINFLVFDEADRLLDRHNEQTVLDIIKTFPREKQMIISSASMTPNVIKRAKSMMTFPEEIFSLAHQSIPDTITHISLYAEKRDKIDLLRKLIKQLDPPKAIIFVNSIDAIEALKEKLKYHDIKTACLYGTIEKGERKIIMANFKSGKVKILIASDIAARGLQMDGITHVFNLELPEQPNDYLHRAGRTGRNGQEGVVISLAASYEVSILQEIRTKFKIEIQKKSYFKGEITD